jgi:hypothetical protein
MEQRGGLRSTARLQKSCERTRRLIPARYDVSVMPAALPVKQQCFGDLAGSGRDARQSAQYEPDC